MLIKKVNIFFFFFCLITLSAFAQDDEYVIEQPKEPKNRVFSTLPNPDYTNYLLSSSAYTLKKRDIRISGTDIIFAKGSYGLSNNTTASLSISLIGGFIGSIKQQLEINEDLKLGASASIGNILSVPEDSTIFFAGGQIMATLGDIQNNITGGIGAYYAKGTFDVINAEREFQLNNFFIATQKQIGRKVYLIAEGMYFWNYNVFSGSLGVKIVIKEYMSLLFGVMPIAWDDPRINQTNVEASAIPLVSFRILLDRH